MKSRFMFALLLMILSVAVIAQNATSGTKDTGQQSIVSQNPPTKAWHLPKGWTADQAYKSNCTRCHAEVPKLNPRQTKTIVRHMRVRANITHDEAEAILQYLNK